MRASHGWSTVIASVAACLVGLATPSFARAGTVNLGEDSLGAFLLFQASSGETNRLYVVFTPGGFRVADLGAPITAGTGCSAVNANEVFCAFTGPFFEFTLNLSVRLGDLDDFVSVSADGAQVFLDGEDGVDELEVRGGCSLVGDTSCNNWLNGGAGDDTLRAAGGNARLDGWTGADTLERFGTAGRVTADYSLRANPVAVDPDGNADDGEPGEGDNVSPGIDFVLGGSAGDVITGVSASGEGGNDLLTAGSKAVSFSGGPGDDVIHGGPRNDLLSGGPRIDWTGTLDNDVLLGAAGRDRLSGGGGMDTLHGGMGRDRLDGGRGRDSMSGGPNNDTLKARDGQRDRINGNRGVDRARIDRRRDRVRNVEALF